MKKNRPGVTLSVLCRAERRRADGGHPVLARRRRWACGAGRPRGSVLARQAHRVETPWGPVEGKVGWLAEGAARFAPEFESCRQIAAQHGLPLREVYAAAQRPFDPAKVQRSG